MTVVSASRPLARPPRLLSWRPSERLVFGLLGFVIIVSIWELASRLKLVRQVVLSSPTLIVEAAVKDISSGAIFPHILVSGQEYVLGLGLALIVGIPLGLAIGLFRRLNYVLDPWLSALYATPTVALVPLIIIIFGIQLEAKVVVVFLESIFVIVVSVMAGVHAADKVYHDIAESFGASAWTRFRTVTLPASTPFVLTGARLGTGRAVVGVVVAEFLVSNSGIGFYIGLNGFIQQTARVYFGIILLGMLGLTIGELVRLIERRFERWRPAIN